MGVAVPLAGGTLLYSLFYGFSALGSQEFYRALFIGTIMTATSEEALAAFLDLFAFSADTDSTLLTGDPVFVVRVTPVENDEYTISVWITDGKLYCVDDRDGMAYVAAGDASDLFAMIAEA